MFDAVKFHFVQLAAEIAERQMQGKGESAISRVRPRTPQTRKTTGKWHGDIKQSTDTAVHSAVPVLAYPGFLRYNVEKKSINISEVKHETVDRCCRYGRCKRNL